MIDDKDAIVNTFRPIEQLFKAMDRAATEVDGNLTRSYAEVGLALCSMFRVKIEEIFRQENRNDHEEET